MENWEWEHNRTGTAVTNILISDPETGATILKCFCGDALAKTCDVAWVAEENYVLCAAECPMGGFCQSLELPPLTANTKWESRGCSDCTDG